MLDVIQSDHNLVGEVVATVMFLGIFVLAVWGMGRGWRTRSQDALRRFGPAPVTQPPAREPDGVALCTGTTVAGSRMERVALPELWGRWGCDWWTEPDALVLRRRNGLTLRLSGIRDAGVTGAHAGRAVGRERIAVVRWTLADAPVDTGLQFGRAEQAHEFVARLRVTVEEQRDA